MSESAQIVLIIVIGIVVLGAVALLLLRNRISSANIKGSKKGVELAMTANEQQRTTVSGNKIKGNDNTLAASNGGVDENTIVGDGNKLGSK